MVVLNQSALIEFYSSLVACCALSSLDNSEQIQVLIDPISCPVDDLQELIICEKTYVAVFDDISAIIDVNNEKRTSNTMLCGPLLGYIHRETFNSLE